MPLVQISISLSLWGTVLSKSAIPALLHSSERKLREIVNEGRGNEHLPLYFGNFIVSYLGLVLTVRPFEDQRLSYDLIGIALDLLRQRGYERGERDEMWAYIFTRGRRIGLMTMSMARRPIKGIPTGDIKPEATS